MLKLLDPAALDAKVTAPRGRVSIVVPQKWLRDGARLSVEVPAKIRCDLCDGGGCDACGRSGAVYTRGRKELPELVEVSLPSSTGGARGATVRLPKRGGLPSDETPELARGMLLLTVIPGEAASDGVRRRELPEAPLPVPYEPAPLAQVPTPAAGYLSPEVLGAVALALLVLLALFVFAR